MKVGQFREPPGGFSFSRHIPRVLHFHLGRDPRLFVCLGHWGSRAPEKVLQVDARPLYKFANSLCFSNLTLTTHVQVCIHSIGTNRRICRCHQDHLLFFQAALQGFPLVVGQHPKLECQRTKPLQGIVLAE